MTDLGCEEIQLGHYGFFSGHLSNLFSGSMEVRIYSCPHCGKMEFFNAEVEHEESFSERLKKIWRTNKWKSMDLINCERCS